MKQKEALQREICRLKSSQKEKTPFYVFDTDALCEHIRNVKCRLLENMTLCYAIKANPFLIEPMDAYLEKYEVCSPGELAICLRAGINTEKIVFSGVNKQKEDIYRAVEAGVGVITLESVRQFELVRECAEERKEVLKVLPRLSSGAQFGIDSIQLQKIIAERESYPYLQIVGVQYFTGTQKKLKKTLEELEFILEYVKMLETKYGFLAQTIEYGPGLKVPYFVGEDFDAPYAELEMLVSFLKERGDKYHFVFELGRYLASGCGHYAASIVDIKENEGRGFALIDGGINHVNYYGQNMAMRLPMLTHYHKKEDFCEEVKKPADADNMPQEEADAYRDWCICGSLCTFADVLIRKAGLHNLELDDILIFHNIGAYSITEGIYLFLSRRMPKVYFYQEKTGLFLVRDSIETSDFNFAGRG